jgi:ABC-type uncharacterized transport system ATPase subunit
MKKFSNAFFKDSAAQVDALLKPVKLAEARLEECQRELLSHGVVQILEISQITEQKQDATREQLALMTRKLAEVQQSQASAIQNGFDGFKSFINSELIQTVKNQNYIMMQEQARLIEYVRSEWSYMKSIAWC